MNAGEVSPAYSNIQGKAFIDMSQLEIGLYLNKLGNLKI